MIDKHGMPRSQSFTAGERVYVVNGMLSKNQACKFFYHGCPHEFYVDAPWNKGDGNNLVFKTKLGINKMPVLPGYIVYPADAVDKVLTEYKKTIAAVQEYKANLAKCKAKTDVFKKMYSGIPVPYGGTFSTEHMVKEIKDEVDEDALKQIESIITPKTSAQYLTHAKYISQATASADTDTIAKLGVALGIATHDADTGEYVWVTTATGPLKPMSETYPLEA